MIYRPYNNSLKAGCCLYYFPYLGANPVSSWNTICSNLFKSSAPVVGALTPDWMTAILQDDGNFVVYYIQGHGGAHADDSPGGDYPGSGMYSKWATNTERKGPPPYKLALGFDGNLILTDGTGKELWRAAPLNPIINQPCILVMQDDGNLVLMDAKANPIWASGTAGQTHN